MISELRQEESFIFNFINDPVFIVDAPGPVTGKAMSERFRFSDSLEWRAFDIPDELIDSLQDFFVGALPVKIIFPGVLREDQIHSTSARLVPAQDSSSAIDSRSRRAFFGLRSRYAVSSRAS